MDAFDHSQCSVAFPDFLNLRTENAYEPVGGFVFLRMLMNIDIQSSENSGLGPIPISG
jgi:hypothetical protein